MSKHDYKTFAQKIEGVVRDKDALLRSVSEALDSHNNGCLEVIVRRAKKDKTDRQLGNIFGNMIKKVVDYCNAESTITDTSEFLDLIFNRPDLPTGVPVTTDFVKNCLYAACPILDEHDRPITLSGMNTEQANKFFTEAAHLLSSRITYIPDPDPNWNENIKE